MAVYKIHPAIGVARVGNAPDEFFIGPESPDELIGPAGGFKDSECRMKRQAVRFYVYRYDTDAGTVEDVTQRLAITWSFTPDCGKIRVFPTTVTFDPPTPTVSGQLDRAPFTLHVTNGAMTAHTPGGELRTDDDGRLILLGGLGIAAHIPGTGSAPLVGVSASWYDDICEGQIQADFTPLEPGAVPVTIYAWAVTAPPRSSPHSVPRRTFYDELVDLATAAGHAEPPEAVPGSPYALDKAQLHFVWGLVPGAGLGEYPELNGRDLRAVMFEAEDPLRPRLPRTGSLFTSGLPNPWHADAAVCGWAGIWSASRVPETFLGSWWYAGISIVRGGETIEVEACDADLSITLLTTSIDFRGVPVGPDAIERTALRAIEFDVFASSLATPVEFSYSVPPTGQFASHGALPPPVSDTGGTTIRVRLWIRYTTTTPGAAEDHMDVIVSGAGTTWTIPLYAHTVGRRTTATALVLDRSGSMAEDAGDGTTRKHQLLREAVSRFLAVAPRGDSIQLVRYDDTAEAIPTADTPPADPATVSGSAVTELTDDTLPTFETLVRDHFDPDGTTSIGAGILVGRSRLDAVTGPDTEKAMVILTDGVENTAPSVADVASSVNATTYAIGLGTPANTSAPVLQALAGNHGGYLLVTGGITDENRFLLDKYFLQILAGISKAEVVLDPQGDLALGVEHPIPFHIIEADSGFEAILVTTLPGAVDFRLISPLGRVLDPARAALDPKLTYRLASGVAFYRVALPAEIASGMPEREGTWHALLTLGRARLPAAKNGRLPFAFLVHAYSSVALRVSLRQTGFDPGASARLSAALLESGALPLAGAHLTAEVTRPDGSLFDLALSPISGEPGHYEAAFSCVAAGVYRCRVLASGESAAGHSFTRERTLTAQVWHGGDRAAQDPFSGAPEGRLNNLVCELLRCLARPGGAASPKLLHKLTALGSCFDRLCKQRPASPAEVSRALELARSKRNEG